MVRSQRTIPFLLFTVFSFLPLHAQSLDERRAEIEAHAALAAQWQDTLTAQEAVVLEVAPSFIAEHRRVQAIELAPDERRALVASGLAGLAPERAELFARAEPAFTAMRAKLTTYFYAYDRYQAAEIHARVVGAVAEVLDRRAQVEGHASPKALAAIDAKVATLLDWETQYRGFLADPAAKNHHRSNAISRLIETAEDTKVLLEREMARAGLLPRPTWVHRLRDFGHRVKKLARLTRIGATVLPAASRIFAYLYNPFRKKPDASKVTRMLNFLARSYRFASGLKVKVAGAEHLPEGQPVIYAFSHRSGIEDAMVMMSILPRDYSFLVAARALPGKLAKKLVRERNIILVGGKKRGPDGELQEIDSVAESIDTLENGLDLVIFPEGTVPSPQKETWPLRSGIDAIAAGVEEDPVSIVPVSIDDPANGYGEGNHPSLDHATEVTVSFARPIDPLKFRSVPGSDPQLLRDVIRAWWHKGLYRPDAAIDVETVGEVAPDSTIPEDPAME